MHNRLTTWLPLVVLAMLGTLAALGRYLETRDSSLPGDGIPDEIVVTSRADRGPGSLRSALFLAMKANHPVTIGLRVPLIELELPLPPVAAAESLRIEGRMPDDTVIDFVTGGDGDTTLLELVSDNIEVAQLHLAANGANGILVRGARATLDGIEVSHANRGLQALDVDQLTVSNSAFTANREGIHINGQSGSLAISDNRFRNNSDHAIWIVFNETPGESTNTIVVHDNEITGGRNGLVAANTVADLRGNRISGFSNAGLLLMQSRVIVSNNRVVSSDGIGLQLAGLRDSLVNNNEIGRNALVGILIVDANGLQVDGNEVYRNGYGIAAVGLEPINAALRNNTLVDQSIDGLIAIGDTPLIDGNVALRNRQAGIRIMDLVLPNVPVIAATPRHANNRLTDNGFDDIQFGRYVVIEP